MKVIRDRNINDKLGEMSPGDYYIRCFRESNTSDITCVNLETGLTIILEPDYLVHKVDFVGYEEY